MTFRHFLFIALVSLVGLNSQALEQRFPTARVSVHDPVIIRQKGTTYVFCTGVIKPAALRLESILTRT
jgi:hypothetical protein